MVTTSICMVLLSIMTWGSVRFSVPCPDKLELRTIICGVRVKISSEFFTLTPKFADPKYEPCQFVDIDCLLMQYSCP